MWYYQDNNRINHHPGIRQNDFLDFKIEKQQYGLVLSFTAEVDDNGEYQVFALVKKTKNFDDHIAYETACGYIFCVERHGSRGYFFQKPRKWWQRLF